MSQEFGGSIAGWFWLEVSNGVAIEMSARAVIIWNLEDWLTCMICFQDGWLTRLASQCQCPSFSHRPLYSAPGVSWQHDNWFLPEHIVYETKTETLMYFMTWLRKSHTIFSACDDGHLGISDTCRGRLWMGINMRRKGALWAILERDYHMRWSRRKDNEITPQTQYWMNTETSIERAAMPGAGSPWAHLSATVGFKNSDLLCQQNEAHLSPLWCSKP